MEKFHPNPHELGSMEIQSFPKLSRQDEENITGAGFLVRKFAILKHVPEGGMKPKRADRLVTDFSSNHEVVNRAFKGIERYLDNPHPDQKIIREAAFILEGLNDATGEDAIRVFGRDREKFLEIARIYCNVVSENLGLLKQLIRAQPRSLVSVESCKAMASVIEFGSEEQRLAARGAVNNLFDIFIHEIDKADTQHIGYELHVLLNLLLGKSDQLTRQRVVDALVNHYCRRNADTDILRKCWAKRHENASYKEVIGEILSWRLGRVGLGNHVDEFLLRLSQGVPSNQGSEIELTLDTLDLVEAHAPGAVKFIFEEHGIVNFGRYPVEMLVAQYEERDNVETPYGVILFPYADHSGSFYSKDNELDGLMKQLDGKRLVRIAEVGSKVQVARRLTQLEAAYGSKQKISFAILGGHGSEESLMWGIDDVDKGSQLNRDFDSQVLALFDLVDTLDSKKNPQERMLAYKRFFVDHPTILLSSCSTGIEGGLAQQLSEVFDAIVVGPSRDTGVHSFKAEWQGDELELGIVYGSAHAMVYDRGILIKGEERQKIEPGFKITYNPSWMTLLK